MNSLAVTALWSFQIISSLAICNLQILYSRNYVGVWACICVLYLCLWHYTDRQRDRHTHTHAATGATTSWISAVLITDFIVLCLLFGLLSFTFLRAGSNSLMHTQIHPHTRTHTHRRHTPALNKRANGGGGNDAWKLTQIVSRLV